MPDALPQTTRPNLRPRPWEILALLPLGTAIGGLLGAGFGVFYGWLFFSPELKNLVSTASRLANSARGPQSLGKVEVDLLQKMIDKVEVDLLQKMIDLEKAAQVHMIWDGLSLGWRVGLVISLVLVIGIALMSKVRCPFRSAVGVQLRVVRGALVFWLVGGINSLILVALAPRWFGGIIYSKLGSFSLLGISQSAFSSSPGPRDAWIWGSVWGFRAGLVLATIGCLVSFANRWRKAEEAARQNRIANESNAQTAHV